MMWDVCVFGEHFPKVRPYEGHILAVSAMDLLEARTVRGEMIQLD